MNLRDNLSFGFEQTFTIEDWWTEPGFTSTSDTPKKREKMLDLARELAVELNGKYFESQDIWKHIQYEVTDKSGKTQFYVTMDPGSIEVKTPPCLAKDAQKMATPLFIAADRAGVVAYRNWWYGVKAGTEGGCHVNMGGFDFESNPLLAEPELVVKYAAYIHNRPWLHHPFMGVDVGPEGNAMRMDEKPGYSEVKKAFKKYNALYSTGDKLTAEQTYDFFKDTNLISEKGSYPSLYKFKEGLFLIEDRGQESLRSAEDFFLVSELRLQIFEMLQQDKLPEELQDFPNLHTTDLTSFMLWNRFKNWAKDFKLETAKYKRFFDLQFPRLSAGENVPQFIKINDGRRPRVITEIHKRGDVVTGKSIDTTYKRLEVYFENDKQNQSLVFDIQGKGIEKISDLIIVDDISFQYIDIKYDSNEPCLNIILKDNSGIVEAGKFNIHNMMWE